MPQHAKFSSNHDFHDNVAEITFHPIPSSHLHASSGLVLCRLLQIIYHLQFAHAHYKYLKLRTGHVSFSRTTISCLILINNNNKKSMSYMSVMIKLLHTYIPLLYKKCEITKMHIGMNCVSIGIEKNHISRR